MLNNALGALFKMIKIETLYQKMVKSENFNFLKVKYYRIQYKYTTFDFLNHYSEDTG